MSAHSTPPRLMLKSTKDALLIIEAAERGLFHRLVRRLTEQERAESIYSGAVFVYDEFESNIKRFTDTLVWSPSRIIGNYLVYREMLKHEPRSTSRAGAALPPVPASARSLARRRPESAMGENERSRKRREQLYVGSLTNSDKFKPDGLVKRTFSLMIEGKHIHVIAYYTYEDAMNESFITPSEHPQFGELPISQDLLRDKSAYRVPPCIETLSNGQLVYAGEDSDKPGSPRSESTSLDTDHNSPIGTPPTGVTPDFSSLPSLPRVHLVPQEGSMYELPPLRPINPGSNWNDVVPSTFDGPAYSTHTRSNASPYSFNGNSTSTSSLAAISLPSLTPPPTRSAPRLRDARQMPYPVPRGGRPNAYNLNIARVHREPEHTPTDPAFEPDSAIDFSSGFGSTPPPYHEGSVSWAPSRFDNGGFGMRQQQRESEGATAPTPIRPRVYEVGPSGERVEYDVHIAAWGHAPLYSDGSGPNAHRNENRGEYEEMNPTDVGFT